MSEVEIEALRRKVTTPQETVEMLIENDPVEGSDVTSVLEIGVEKNHPEADVRMEGTDELHQNDDTQRTTSRGVGKGGAGGGALASHDFVGLTFF